SHGHAAALTHPRSRKTPGALNALAETNNRRGLSTSGLPICLHAEPFEGFSLLHHSTDRSATKDAQIVAIRQSDRVNRSISGDGIGRTASFTATALALKKFLR